MAARIFVTAPQTAAGAVVTGAAVAFTTFTVYDAAGTAADPQPADPTITERGTTGLYAYEVELAAGQWAEGIIDRGATAWPRLEPVQAFYSDTIVPAVAADVPSAATIAAAVWAAATRTLSAFGTLVADVAASITADHGTGSYLRAIGAGAQACTITATDGSTPLVGARVDAFNAAGSVLLATGYTGSAGTVVLYLDAGAVKLRSTLAGYSFAAVDATVSATDTISPASVTGVALPAAAGTSVTGASRALSWATLLEDQTISGIVSGDTLRLDRSISDLDAGRTVIRATLSVSGATDRAHGPAAKLLTAAATIDDAGSTGTALVHWSLAAGATSPLRNGAPYYYDVEIELDNGTIRTRELGLITAEQGVTT